MKSKLLWVWEGLGGEGWKAAIETAVETESGLESREIGKFCFVNLKTDK